MWEVRKKRQAVKNSLKLPGKIQEILEAFLKEMEILGPYRSNWPNYGKLDSEKYHCHLKKGTPTYVICWEIIDKKIRVTEVTYVGTHEKAPY